MSLDRMLYRAHQFFRAVWASIDPADLEQARTVLTPAQMALFVGMQSSEQAHALNVYRQLLAQGETSPDLLTAALLHDVGKSCRPLRLWERVLIVIAKAFYPAQSRRWGRADPEAARKKVLKQAFAVAEQHPAWGAELAVEAGASMLTVELIRLHQDPSSTAVEAEVKRLLLKLQAVDDHN